MKYKKNFLLYLSLLLLFIAVRITLLSQKNLWFDEIYSWHITLGSFKDIIIQTAGDIHPPLFYFSLKLWIILFGDSVLAMRSLSVFFSVISFIFLYKYSLRITSETNIVLILLIYSLSPLNVYFSQELRMSMMNLSLNMITCYLFLRIIEFIQNEEYKNHIYLYLISYILITLYSLYTHYFSLFILIAHIIFITLYHRKISIKYIKLFLVTYIVIFLAYIPWVPIFLDQVSKGQSWRYEQNITEVIAVINTFNNDLYYGFYHRYITFNYYLLFNIMALICSLIIIVLIIFNFLKKKINWKFTLTLLIFSVPLLFAIIISFRQWVEFFRYLSIIIPFLIIIIVYKLSEINKQLKNTFIIVLICMHITGLYLYFNIDSKNNDYRKLTAYIQDNSKDAEKIFVYPHYFGWIVEYLEKSNSNNKAKSFDYGWNKDMMLTKINNDDINSFWLILDNETQDSLKHFEIVDNIKNKFDMKLQNKFNLMPNTVDVYLFKRK